MTDLAIAAQHSAGAGTVLWLLWGGVGIFLIGIYMAVYFLIRTRWGHRSDATLVVPDDELHST